jgi:hypothetical protein
MSRVVQNLRNLKRLISTAIASTALLVLNVAMPLHHLALHHLALHGHDEGLLHHDHEQFGDAEHSADESPTDSDSSHHSSHTCPICVMLSIGCVQSITVAATDSHPLAQERATSTESIDLPLPDRQLPGARAPPASALS